MEDLLAALECVTEEFSQLPDGSALIEKIHQKFNQFFECPQVGEISRILHSQFSVEEIRKLAFAPSSQQIRFKYFYFN